MEMDKTQLEETLRTFISNNSGNNEILDNVDPEKTELKFERLNGLSNAIYLVILCNRESGEEINRFILRNFGQSSDFLDRDLEQYIINSLAEKGFVPKIYETDNVSYRIEEYIENSKNLAKHKLFEKNTLDNLIRILVSYTMISDLYYFYYIEEGPDKAIKIQRIDVSKQTESCLAQAENKQEDPNKSPENKPYANVQQNIYEMCLDKMYSKAQKNFEKIVERILNEDQIEFDLLALDVIRKNLNNFKDSFFSAFPQKGLLVLNHNDVHRLNILEADNKIMLIDHEYSALNLIGSDIVNYCIENCFDYTLKKFPFYEFKKQQLNFDFMFKIYQKFLVEFERNYKKKLCKLDENVFNLFEETKTYKYFLRLIAVISLFWFLYSVIYINPENNEEKNNFDYFSYAKDRLILYEKAIQELKNL